MSTTVTLDNTGRIVIPKTLREELHLEAGDKLEVTAAGDSVTLRPVRSASPLRKERGIWVFRAGGKLTAADTDKVLRQTREKRDQNIRGETD